ncbi:MAG: metallophosphoesterase [Planctomycetota bacterium]
MKQVDGLMFIGDPHLEPRVPGFRKDDYPQVVLEKFRWCLQTARSRNWQAFLLGDLFQLPQDNPNWLLTEIIQAIETHWGDPLLSIYGNHDVRENQLKSNDSISVLVASGHVQLVSEESPWRGRVGKQTVVVGGTSWNQRLPDSFAAKKRDDLVVWMTHHDLKVPGFEESAYLRPRAIKGIDVVVNGHIHRSLPTVTTGNTSWLTPGNIVRRSRGDATRDHIPSVLCLQPSANRLRPAVDETAVQQDSAVDSLPHSGDQLSLFTDCDPDDSKPASNAVQQRRVDAAHSEPSDPDDGRLQPGIPSPLLVRGKSDWVAERVMVPHQPYDEVFHPEVIGDEVGQDASSAFIAHLNALTQHRTDTGAGLMEFLEQNLHHFDAPVASEIRRLAEEVTHTSPQEIG